jgi:hypothetical protein
MVVPLGGVVEDPGAPTTYVGDVDGGSPRRRSQRAKNAHHLCRRRRWRAPWEVRTPVVHRCVVTCIGSIDRSNSAHKSHSPYA